MKKLFILIMFLFGCHSGKMKKPEYLFKIVTTENWEKSQAVGHIIPSAIDSSFIHLSTEEQLPRIANKFFANQPHLILKLETKKLIGELKFETNPGGSTKFYHLYNGKIPLEAVVKINL